MRFSSLEEKIVWLLANRIHLIGKFNPEKVIRHMKRDGLLSSKTYWPDARSSIEKAVEKAKFRWYAEHNGREIK